MKYININIAIMLCLFSIFLFMPTDARAEDTIGLTNVGLMDTVLERFKTASSSWLTVFKNAASYLFWSLVAISMVWTFGTMALKRADMQEFFVEFIKYIVFVGFFWFLITKAELIGSSIFQNLVGRGRRRHLSQKIGEPILNYA